MFSIDEIERTIASIRSQADALEANANTMRTSANALEAAIAPVKMALENANAAQQMFVGFWSGQGLLTSMTKPDKLDFKI